MAIEEEKLDFARRMADGIIDKLGIPADITVQEKKGKLSLDIKTPEPGRLIGRKGRSLWYLEYLLNRLVGHEFEDAPSVVIDVDGYRQSDGEEPAENQEQSPAEETKGRPAKKNKLQQFAVDAAKEVKRWGEPKTIGPYDPDDCQAVVDILEKEDGIVIESQEDSAGDKPRKKITIRAKDE